MSLLKWCNIRVLPLKFSKSNLPFHNGYISSFFLCALFIIFFIKSSYGSYRNSIWDLLVHVFLSVLLIIAPLFLGFTLKQEIKCPPDVMEMFFILKLFPFSLKKFHQYIFSSLNFEIMYFRLGHMIFYDN